MLNIKHIIPRRTSHSNINATDAQTAPIISVIQKSIEQRNMNANKPQGSFVLTRLNGEKNF